MTPIPPYTPPTTPQKPKKKVDPVTTAVFIVATAIALWMFFADIWPVSAIIEFQAGIFNGSYYPKLTILIIILIVAIPMIAVQKLIQLLLKKKE